MTDHEKEILELKEQIKKAEIEYQRLHDLLPWDRSPGFWFDSDCENGDKMKYQEVLIDALNVQIARLVPRRPIGGMDFKLEHPMIAQIENINKDKMLEVHMACKAIPNAETHETPSNTPHKQ